jgi:hypothetical protein
LIDISACLLPDLSTSCLSIFFLGLPTLLLVLGWLSRACLNYSLWAYPWNVFVPFMSSAHDPVGNVLNVTCLSYIFIRYSISSRLSNDFP